MKKLEAIVQPFKMEEVKEALKAIGIDGTPAFIVDGKIREGGLDDEVLKHMSGI